MPTVPYVKQGAPYIDHASDPDATFAAADANAMDDGIYSAHLMPAVRVYHNATQSISSSTETTLAFNSERYDQAGGVASNMHDTVTSNSRLTCRYAGVYDITASVDWPASVGNDRTLRIRKNGSDYIGRVDWNGTGGSTAQSVSTKALLDVNDYVEVRVYHGSAGSLSIAASNSSTNQYQCEFMMVRVA
jgi:hypothetical protein